MRIFLIIILGFFLSFIGNSQQTVGTFLNLESSYNGYTLIFPSASTETYLINNCGQVVNQWSSNYQAGIAAYLLENGNLLRAGRIPGSFSGGGLGGRIEMFSWDGVLLWSYNHASTEFHHHHDVEFLPNGNILIIAWESRSQNEAIEMGRIPGTVSNAGLWPEQIIEVMPVGSNEVNIVWEWHAWDHLIQDFDPNKPNFGVISEHPELLNLNIIVGGGGGTSTDWMHVNSIDYNPVLDQIIISSRTMNELFIIDHSTTTEEAAGHTGGVFGKGGDFLYRWGNPVQYGRGTISDQQLFGQHDVHWIPYDVPGGGQIMAFNNGGGRPEGTYSTVDIILPPIDQNGGYNIEDGQSFGPEAANWSYQAIPATSLFANRVSGAQRLPNGNTLICEGTSGYIFEVDENFNTVWSYKNPVNQGGPVSQSAHPGNNGVFRAYRYGPDYPAFENIDLVAGEYLELNPIDYGCKIFSGTSALHDINPELQNIFLISNPVEDLLEINNEQRIELNIEIIDLNGRGIYSFRSNDQSIELNVDHLNSGFYILNMVDYQNQKWKTEKFIKI